MSESETTPAAETAAIENPNKSAILALTAKKHVKMYLLKTVAGMKGSHIAKELNTNAGHVGNELKKYKEDATRVEKAVNLWEEANASPTDEVTGVNPNASTTDEVPGVNLLDDSNLSVE